MADLMPQHAGQFRLIIHQRHQLARDIDIATRNGEGVVDRRVEQGDGEVALGVGQAGLDRDPPPDAFDIFRLGTAIAPAKFLEQFRVLLGPAALVLRADRTHRADRPLLPDHGRGAGGHNQGGRRTAKHHLPVHHFIPSHSHYRHVTRNRGQLFQKRRGFKRLWPEIYRPGQCAARWHPCSTTHPVPLRSRCPDWQSPEPGRDARRPSVPARPGR